MKRLGPLLTLAAVVLFGAILLAVDMSKDTPTPAANPYAPTTTAAAPATTIPPATTPAAIPFPAKADYVGTTTGAPLTVSIAVKDNKATAYVCDGKSVESWLQGGATDGSVHLTGWNNAKLYGSYDGAAVHGILALAGKQWDFTAAPVNSPGGLYVNRTDNSRQSWIVDANGRVTGVQRTADGGTSPAPVLAPDGTAIINGHKITATKVSGGDSVG
ncbi:MULTISPECIES: hypothetical protein [unclassified Nocardia]|uniref:hypothetical protein n=1 Tax=unclassified Nocardia TaxID=2637762 RepID=UPI001CE3F938|nr:MULTISPECIES: hypothetical protein [unclassified Nocardia]